jgi:hypothetical protein
LQSSNPFILLWCRIGSIKVCRCQSRSISKKIWVSCRLNQSSNFANCALIFAIFVKFVVTQFVHSSSSTMDVVAEIEKVRSKIKKVEGQSEAVHQEHEGVREQLKKAQPSDTSFLKEEMTKLLDRENKLLDKDKLLQKKENLLLKRETQSGNVYRNVYCHLGLNF